MRKIIFLDVDGTLVNYENKLPASAVTAIRQARKNGHLVLICTGRSKAEVYPELWDIGLDGMIGGNGSYVEFRGKVLMHQLISPAQCRHIVDWLNGRGLAFYLESNSGLYASAGFEAAAEQTVREYSARKNKPNAEQATVRTAFPDMIFDGALYRDDVNKVSFVLSSYQDHLDSVAEFPDLKPGTWGGAGERALFGDLGVKDITKAHAIDVLLRELGADRADTVAFGDAAIDIPMLEYCQIGVAMGNGGDGIKAVADMITDDVDHDGIFNAFTKLRLI